MPTIETFFVTEIYRAEAVVPSEQLLADLDAACRQLSVDDTAGLRWCAKNGYPGYTSYASLDDLPWRFPAFGQLVKRLNLHAKAFAKALEWDLSGKALSLDSIWVNVLPEGGMHGSHIHPQSVISGTFYVAVPDGAGALKFEDPRLGLMMAAPPRRKSSASQRRSFVSVAPSPGTVLLWESFLRHEVPLNQSADDRISISFNYRWS